MIIERQTLESGDMMLSVAVEVAGETYRHGLRYPAGQTIADEDAMPKFIEWHRALLRDKGAPAL